MKAQGIYLRIECIETGCSHGSQSTAPGLWHRPEIVERSRDIAKRLSVQHEAVGLMVDREPGLVLQDVEFIKCQLSHESSRETNLATFGTTAQAHTKADGEGHHRDDHTSTHGHCQFTFGAKTTAHFYSDGTWKANTETRLKARSFYLSFRFKLPRRYRRPFPSTDRSTMSSDSMGNG